MLKTWEHHHLVSLGQNSIKLTSCGEPMNISKIFDQYKRLVLCVSLVFSLRTLISPIIAWRQSTSLNNVRRHPSNIGQVRVNLGMCVYMNEYSNWPLPASNSVLSLARYPASVCWNICDRLKRVWFCHVQYISGTGWAILPTTNACRLPNYSILWHWVGLQIGKV